jgi:ligand-binding sensor protein
MEALNLLSRAKWEETLHKFARQVRMAACLTDERGAIILCQQERRPLCLAIQANKDAKSAICSQVSSSMTQTMRSTLKPEVGICDAGLLRIAVPVIRLGFLVGQVTACGLTCDEEDVSTFLLGRMLDLPEERVQQLAGSTPLGIMDELNVSSMRLFRELNPL